MPGSAAAAPASRELRALVGLALPIIVTQIGAMTLGVVDTIMVGRLSVDALAAAALGNVWVMGTMILGMGVMHGIDPIVAQAHGSGDSRRQGVVLQRALVLALLLSAPLAGLWWFTEGILGALGQTAELAALAGGYVRVQIPSIPAFLAFYALRQYLQGRGVVAPAMWVIVGANLLNVGANQLLIFGGLGLPGLGLVGAGAATALTRLSLLVGLALLVRAFDLHRGAWPRWGRHALDPAGLREILAFGVPVGVQLGLEMWAFQVTTLIAGWVGEVGLAAHTVVLNTSALTYMVPLGLSMAVATRIGNLVGAGRLREAQRSGWLALGLSVAIMSTSALLLVALRGVVPALYTDDLAVAGLAASLLPIAACFQLFDGAQVVSSGILRGIGRTRPAAAFNLVGYYVLGLPLGLWLVFDGGLGVAGLWWGLTLALGVIAALLVAWVRRRGPASLAAAPGES
ncbi:MAG: MATE family efflux transporter [Nannocystaceae bacterium]